MSIVTSACTACAINQYTTAVGSTAAGACLASTDPKRGCRGDKDWLSYWWSPVYWWCTSEALRIERMVIGQWSFVCKVPAEILDYSISIDTPCRHEYVIHGCFWAAFTKLHSLNFATKAWIAVSWKCTTDRSWSCHQICHGLYGQFGRSRLVTRWWWRLCCCLWKLKKNQS
jgi:hypothetical protein